MQQHEAQECSLTWKYCPSGGAGGRGTAATGGGGAAARGGVSALARHSRCRPCEACVAEGSAWKLPLSSHSRGSWGPRGNNEMGRARVLIKD